MKKAQKKIEKLKAKQEEAIIKAAEKAYMKKVALRAKKREKLARSREAKKEKKQTVKEAKTLGRKIASKHKKTVEQTAETTSTKDAHDKLAAKLRGVAGKNVTIDNATIDAVMDFRSSTAYQEREKRLLQLAIKFAKTNINLRRGVRKDAIEPGKGVIRAVVSLILQGNYPDVAARACGIPSWTFKNWVRRGFLDIGDEKSSSFGDFVRAMDAADAQNEVQDIAMIGERVNNWQALAWVRERKAYGRWGNKIGVVGGGLEQMAPERLTENDNTPQMTGEVLAVLEAAGIIASPGQEHLSGDAVVIDITPEPSSKEPVPISVEPMEDQLLPQVNTVAEGESIAAKPEFADDKPGFFAFGPDRRKDIDE